MKGDFEDTKNILPENTKTNFTFCSALIQAFNTVPLPTLSGKLFEEVIKRGRNVSNPILRIFSVDSMLKNFLHCPMQIQCFCHGIVLSFFV